MFHLHVRRVSRGAARGALDHFDYTRRKGRYANRGDVVRLVHSVNLPRWAADDPALYWHALDQEHIRINARLLFSVEAAIPRALSVADQNELVLRFVRYVSRMSTGRPGRANLPAAYGIHEGIRLAPPEPGRLPNPHFHLQLSVSINDHIDRPQGLWFRRANAADPAGSGAPRSAYIGLKCWLYKVRRAWARFANAALRRAGLPATLDHRSNWARGLAALPTVHLGPKAAALARAGTPVPKALRNERIRNFNKRLEEIHLRRLTLQRKEEQVKRSNEALEMILKDEYKRSRRNLHRLLSAHPLAGGVDDLLAHSTVLLATSDRQHPLQDISGAGAQVLLQLVRDELGPDWLGMRVRDRLWMIREASEEVLVIGAGFVATSAASAVGWVATVATRLGLSNLIGYAGQDAEAEVKGQVDQVLALTARRCDWRGRRVAKAAMIMSR